MNELICPKCRGVMRQYERSGVTIDQCTECRGIFLDRGELERLADAEVRWHDSARAAGGVPTRPHGYDQRHGYGHDRPHYGHDDDDDDDDRRHYGYGHRPRRKRSFLDDLFD